MSNILRKSFPHLWAKIAEWRVTDPALNEACEDYELLHDELSQADHEGANISVELREDLEASLSGLNHEIIKRLGRMENRKPAQKRQPDSNHNTRTI